MPARPVFLLSPANCGGRRAGYLLREGSELELAHRLGTAAGAPIGEVFAFLSGLYFRGKLAYVRAFGSAGHVITTDRGLVHVDQPIRLEDLRAFARVEPDPAEPRYREPLAAAVRGLLDTSDAQTPIVFLGSIASAKYLPILFPLLGTRLHAPEAFTGRGDLSRGGLMLRAVEAGEELAYVPVASMARRGRRPPRLERRP